MKNVQTVGKAVQIQPVPAAIEVVACGSRLHEYQELGIINQKIRETVSESLGRVRDSRLLINKAFFQYEIFQIWK